MSKYCEAEQEPDRSAEIRPECSTPLAVTDGSFNVRVGPNRSVGGSCAAAEAWRSETYARLANYFRTGNALGFRHPALTAQMLNNIDNDVAQLDQLTADLTRAKINTGIIGGASTSTAIAGAVVSLATCLESFGLGCALGAGIAGAGSGVTAASIDLNLEAIAEIRRRMVERRNRITQGVIDFEQPVNEEIRKLNQVCEAVMSACTP
ncbi:MAG: hypothetical protein K0U93_06075 [Gammaproteobacteria bacterium]|nr:hypothetical protein [Gammaproteobacteria bacterium]